MLLCIDKSKFWHVEIKIYKIACSITICDTKIYIMSIYWRQAYHMPNAFILFANIFIRRSLSRVDVTSLFTFILSFMYKSNTPIVLYLAQVNNLFLFMQLCNYIEC